MIFLIPFWPRRPGLNDLCLESHIHSLLTILRYGGLCSTNDEQWSRALDYVSRVSELNYMTQIVIMLYEDPNKPIDSPDRFHIELHFSPGAKAYQEDSYPQGTGFRPASQPPSRDVSIICHCHTLGCDTLGTCDMSHQCVIGNHMLSLKNIINL